MAKTNWLYQATTHSVKLKLLARTASISKMCAIMRTLPKHHLHQRNHRLFQRRDVTPPQPPAKSDRGPQNLLFSSVETKVFAFLPLAHAYACSLTSCIPSSFQNEIHQFHGPSYLKLLLAAMKDLQPEVVLLRLSLLIEEIYSKLQPTLETKKMKVLKVPGIRNIIFKENP